MALRGIRRPFPSPAISCWWNNIFLRLMRWSISRIRSDGTVTQAMVTAAPDGASWNPQAFSVAGDKLLVEQYISATHALVHQQDQIGRDGDTSHGNRGAGWRFVESAGLFRRRR